jgi:hypothetical protein
MNELEAIETPDGLGIRGNLAVGDFGADTYVLRLDPSDLGLFFLK